MAWCSLRVASISHKAECIAWLDEISWTHIPVAAQMSVVVPGSSRTKNPYDLSTQVVLADRHHDSFCGTDDRAPAGSEDIDAFMRATATASRTPGIRQRWGADTFNRNM